MKYTALYRKYRPTRFEEVYGQDHIVTALTNQLKADRIAHAYLFSGTRGTGKTTLAKILASAVNCEAGTSKPCCECSSCKAVEEGRSLNVVEMDAASNNGVDDVRNIVEEIGYPPVEGKYKVYIIDEVHMLSVNAFNALLKTLEEPPSYVIFILATTEPNKLPATILSRCQRYEFRQISSEVIFRRIKDIAQKETLSADDAALEYIARAGEGSMRDALSIMDRCAAFGIGQTVTAEMISSLLGTADHKAFGDMIRAIQTKNILQLLDIVKEFSKKGLDYYRLTADFLWFLRNIMILKVDPSLTDLLNVSRETAEDMKEAAGLLELSEIREYMELLSNLYHRLKYSPVQRIELEICLISMCKADTGKKALQEPERKPTEGMLKEPVVEVSKQEPIKEASKEEPIREALSSQTETLDPSGVSALLLANTSGLMNSMLKKITIKLENKDIILYSDNKLCGNYFNDDTKKTELNQILEKSGHIGYNIKCLVSVEPEKVRSRQEIEEKIKSSIDQSVMKWEE